MTIAVKVIKRPQHLPYFGFKYLSNDGSNHDRFHGEIFLKIYTFRPAKKSWANFEWSVPLSVKKCRH